MGVSVPSLKSPSTQITGNQGPNVVWMVLVPNPCYVGIRTLRVLCHVSCCNENRHIDKVLTIIYYNIV